MPVNNCVISLSGGMDSGTLLAKMVNDNPDANKQALFFMYGSKHNEFEIGAARTLAATYGVPLEVVNLTEVSKLLKSNLLQTGGDIPEGHYEAQSMSQTVVPGRNSIFIAILTGLCESLGGGNVYVGVHAGDHAIYPDCRAAYIRAMFEAMQLASDFKVKVQAPFLHIDKSGICEIGLGLGVPYQYTRTCYKQQSIACGKCGSCCERREAFMKNNAVDPIEYVYNGPLPERPNAGT